jgi:hypothetical protein
MKREDDEQLWNLLGRSAEAKVSPFFARNILREVREEQSQRARTWVWLRRLVPASVLALAVVGAMIFMRDQSPQEVSIENQIDPVVASIDIQDYEVVADLDNLLASDENSPWDESSTL